VGLLQGKRNGSHASVSLRNPQARTDGLIVEEVGDEVLVYDSTAKRAHCLGATAARVWRACDGNANVEALSVALDLSTDTVTRALAELEQSKLLSGLEIHEGGSSNGRGNGITRRQLTARSAKIGTAVISAPLILSIAAPTAMAAATPLPFQCQLFSTDGCGSCKIIAGCCCCDVSCGGECKVCSSVNFCNAGTQDCQGAPPQKAAHCSDIGSGTPVSVSGCCGQSFPAARGCGCAFSGTTDATCCDSTTGAACTSTANCVPCCKGVPIVIDPLNPNGAIGSCN
jgi:hypothetical protein